MFTKQGLIYLNILPVFPIALILSFYPFRTSHNNRQQNQAPVVKIINPKNNAFFDWGEPINYEITVADKEDGDSKFDEINAKEVLLEVRHSVSTAKMQVVLNKGMQPDPPGLVVIRSSNCFNCHNFKSKSIGPSFYDISKRYALTQQNIDSMVKRIRGGSTGIWVKEKMPDHPELSARETKDAVNWILKNCADPNVDYYIGLQGSFRIKPLNTNVKKGIYTLTASYTDHGLKDVPGKRLKGQDVAVIYGK
jgi:cytochrome c